MMAPTTPATTLATTRAQLVAQALQWQGTPYHHHARIQGAGVDCAMLLAEVYAAAGLVPPIDAGFYPHDWHLHRSEELFLAWLARVGAQPVQTPALGDVAVFRFGRTYSHGAIVINAGPVPVLLHAYVGRGVIVTALDEEPLSGRDVQFFSLWGTAT